VGVAVVVAVVVAVLVAATSVIVLVDVLVAVIEQEEADVELEVEEEVAATFFSSRIREYHFSLILKLPLQTSIAGKTVIPQDGLPRKISVTSW
jgi:hypothetical protein